MDDRLIALLAERAASGVPCAVATVVRCAPPTSAHPGDKAVVEADGRLVGWIGGSCSETVVRREALRAIEEGAPRMVRILPSQEVSESEARGELTLATTCPSGGSLEIFIEPQLPRPLLVVVGASPAARTLVQLAALTGFRVCAVHPGAAPADFPDASIVLPTLDLSSLAPGPDSWIVVATMGHYDEDALEAALAHPWADVALVASVRRAEAVMQGLRARGLDDAVLGRIRTPAGGVRAGAQEEIALLALAEVVTLRNGRTAPARPGPAAPPAEALFATDPVCGMAVEVATSAHRAEHAGVTYHFCCGGCRERFAADPARYLSPAGA